MDSLFPILIAIIVVAVFGIILSLALGSKSKGDKGNKRQKERQIIIRDATKKLTSDPHNVPALTELSNLYYKEHNWQGAYPLYSTLMNLATTRVGINLAESKLKHGVCAANLGKTQEALKSLLEARKLNPDIFDVNYYLGKVLVEQKEYEKAIPLLKKAITINGEVPDCYGLIGKAYYLSKKYKESLPYLRKALDSNPEDKELLFSMADALNESGTPDRAIKVFMHLRPDPVYGAQSCLAAGIYHIRCNQNDAAIKDFEIGIKHENAPIDLLLNIKYRLAQCYIKDSNMIAGLNLFKNIQANHPNYKDVPALITKYQELNSLHNIKFVIVASQDDRTVINSVNSLNDETVYVLKNSLLEKYINNLGNMKVKTYSNDKELKKAIKNKEMIIMDKESFNYYHHSILESYNIRYENVLSTTYNFYVKNSDTLSLLFNKYIQTLDPEQLRIDGIYNHEATMKSGTLLGQIAKYSLIIIGLITIVSYIVYRSTKRIKITKKIKKEDKLKYIDQLTSLKNRNYLNENIANWNKNTIYPQATIIIDLNQVQTINDTLGYEQGDAQIKAAANVLIKTQLDNTDIMRTDGNEYLIYLVGYQEKQVVSYIRKLYKEFKNLPYEHGAAIGYSMITNDIKTIEDAINESVDDMRNKKEELENS